MTVRATLLAFAWSVSLSAYAMADAPKKLDLPAGELIPALDALANQAVIELVYQPDQLKALHTRGLHGTYTPEAAIRILLKGTPLELHRDRSGAMVISPIQDKSHPTTSAPVSDAGIGEDNDPRDDRQLSGRQTMLAQAGETRTGDRAVEPSGVSGPGVDHGSVLQEVIVTAQKRVESALNVPISLTALNGEELQRTQSFRYQDFVDTVPGLQFNVNSGLGGQFEIRGISGGENASVATYIDETPYTAVGPYSGGTLMSPDLDTFDMNRIEVLRGPQGTLYGASALGGLIKYVTNAPDPSGFEAAAQSGVSSVNHGGTGDEVHGMINVPLTSRAALRIVGYDNYYPGFIDDPSRNLSDINGSRYAGGRASVLVNATDDLSVRVTGSYQERSFNDYAGGQDLVHGALTPLHGTLTEERLITQPGYAVTQLYNATINWNLGPASFLSTTSYSRYQTHTLWDDTAALGSGVSFSRPQDSLTQEIRLASRDDQAFKWQLGGFFTNQNEWESENLVPIDNGTVIYPPTICCRLNQHYREEAIFANINYAVTPAVELGIGGRFSKNNQTFDERLTFGGNTNEIFDTSAERVGTFSADAQWHFLPKGMVYARIASGFIPGGPNDFVPGSRPFPSTFGSSTAYSYEVGIKSQWLENRLTAEVSTFWIDWRHIQLSEVVNGYGTIANGGRARTDGVEWTLTYLPIQKLTLRFNGAYTGAHLTESAPTADCVVDPTALTPCIGLSGNRLPYVPLWQTSAAAEFRQPLPGHLTGIFGADWRFVSDRFTDFVGTSYGDSRLLPSYNIVNARGGVETTHWSFNVYVKNLADKRALLSFSTPPDNAIVYTPRTIGASVSVRY